MKWSYEAISVQTFVFFDTLFLGLLKVSMSNKLVEVIKKIYNEYISYDNFFMRRNVRTAKFPYNNFFSVLASSLIVGDIRFSCFFFELWKH